MYRVYVTDSLRLLTNADERYLEWVQPSNEKDTRTGDEIKKDIIAALGGMENQNGFVRSLGENNA